MSDTPVYIVIDFETFSEVDVGDVGAAAYAEHPSTEILCMSWILVKGGEIHTRGRWIPADPFPKTVLDHCYHGGLFVAHNVFFETNIWKNLLASKSHIKYFGEWCPLPPNMPMPKRWRDTLASCAYRSIPLKLDKAGEVLNLDVQKDQRGKYLIRTLCQPRKPTKKDATTRVDDAALLTELADYCDVDTEAELDLYKTVGDLPNSELKVWLMDQQINHRGMKIDLETVQAAKEIRDTLFDRLLNELQTITDGEVTTGKQVDRIRKWCEEHRVYLDNLQKSTVTQALEDVKARIENGESDLEDAKRVLEIRQMLGNSSVAKLDKMLEMVSTDGRARGLMQYHGGGTGRWAGRLAQPHNMPSPSVTNAEGKTKNGESYSYFDMDLLVEHIQQRDPELLSLIYENPADALATSLRGMFVADEGRILYVVDYKAIEARGVMWLAQQEDALQAFRDFDAGIGPDIYCEMAEKIYGYPVNKIEHPQERQSGKITILGCGYQMGPPKLKGQAETDYGVSITDEQAETWVYTYRDTYDNVPQLWYGLERAAKEAITTGKRQTFSYVAFDIVEDAAGRWLVCILPNRRRLWYYNPRLRPVTTPWGEEKMQISYEGRDNKKGGAWGVIYTYGGMLTENIVQAISRDVMVEAMFRLQEAGYPVILTVHDEIVAETDENFGAMNEFLELTRSPTPSWAPGFPIAVEGWCGKRYKKE